MGGSASLRIRVLGALDVHRGDDHVSLPQSKKARGLLAYLALTRRSHSRARLCDLFWDVADDPRGGLRWCLSRLRGAFGHSAVIVADRTTVSLDPERLSVDLLDVRGRCANGLRGLSVAELHDLLARFRGDLLEGMDFADLHAAQAWCVAERRDAHRLHASIVAELADRMDDDPDEALRLARLLVHLEPDDDAARARLVRLLLETGDRQSAERVYDAGIHELSMRGLSSHALRVAWRESRPRPGGPAPAVAHAPAPHSTLLGRDDEIERLQAALRQALAGQGGIYTVTGEAGIGKSRLVREVVAHADRQGVRVLVGGCMSASGAPPYLPFIEALDGAAAQLPPAELGPDLPRLARMLPSLAHRTDLDVETGVVESDRYAVFHAAAALLRRLAAPSGLVLVLEDLHWADHQSLLLLGHLARHIAGARLLVICTYRDDEPTRGPALEETLAGLRRESIHRRLDLRRLDPGAARALINTLARMSERSVEAILARTEGHPLFIVETVEHLLEARGGDGEVAIDASALGELGLPVGVREVIGRRLARLSGECRALLARASAFPGAVPWPLLVSVSDADEDRLLDLLDEALTARIVRERAGVRSGNYEFTHALIRQALYEQLSAPRRARLHRSIGTAIEQVYGSNLDEHLDDLAHHFYQGLASGGLDKLVDYALQAGKRATRVMAFEEAAAHYQRALDAVGERGGASGDALRAELHELLGLSLATMCRWAEARDHFHAALAHLPEGHERERARLLLRTALSHFWTLDIGPLRANAGQALALAEAAGDATLMAAATGFLAQAGHIRGEVGRGRERYEGARRLAAPASDPLVAQSLQQYPLNLHWMGRFREAIERGRELAALARANSDGTLLMCILPAVALAMGCAGRYRDADATVREALRFGREHKIVGLRIRATAMSVGALFDLGDLARAAERAQEAQEEARAYAFWPPFVSSRIDSLLIAIAAGELGEAGDMLPEVDADIARVGGWHEWMWRLRYQLATAQLAAATGRWDDALLAADATVARARATERPKYVVDGLLAKGAALRGMGRSRDALATLREALALAQPLGYPALVVRVAAHLIDLEGDDDVLARARAATAHIAVELDGLDDPAPARRFRESRAVRIIASA